TTRQKCSKLQQPQSLRAGRKKRLPNGGNLPILGIGSFLHAPASRPGGFFTDMEGKTLHFGNPPVARREDLYSLSKVRCQLLALRAFQVPCVPLCHLQGVESQVIDPCLPAGAEQPRYERPQGWTGVREQLTKQEKLPRRPGLH